MREIIFRGKRVDNNEWVEGFYVNVPEHYKQEMSGKNYIVSINNGLFMEVVPESVSEYTGLTDKNGKKIFEGDIIAIDKDSIYYHTASGPVRTYKGMWVSFYLPDAHGGDCYDELYRINAEREVIGNIYDNPELLKVIR